MHTLTACQKPAFLTMCHFQEGQAQGLVVLAHLMASCWLPVVTADSGPQGHGMKNRVNARDLLVGAQACSSHEAVSVLFTVTDV